MIRTFLTSSLVWHSKTLEQTKLGRERALIESVLTFAKFDKACPTKNLHVKYTRANYRPERISEYPPM